MDAIVASFGLEEGLLRGFVFGLVSPKFFNRQFSQKTMDKQLGTLSSRKLRYENTFNLFLSDTSCKASAIVFLYLLITVCSILRPNLRLSF